MMLFTEYLGFFMKKVIILFIALIIIVLGVGPWITGHYFKKNYLDLIANYNQNNSGTFKITVLDYSAGWMSSRVILQLTPVKNNITGMTFINIEENISHGPLVFGQGKTLPTIAAASILSTVRLPDQINALLFGKGRPEGLASIHSLAYFDGNCVNHIQMLPVNTSILGMANLDWQGLNGVITFKVNTKTNQISQLNSDLTIENLSLKLNDALGMGQNTEFVLQSLVLKTDTALPSIDISSGGSQLTISGASWKNSTGLQFGLNNLVVQGSSQMNADNMVNFSNTLSIQKIEVPHYVIPVISAINYNLLVNNINAKELNAFIKLMQPGSNNDKQLEMQIPRIITATTNVKFDTGFNTPLGIFVFKGLAFWPAKVALPTTADEMRVNANAKADVRISIPLAKVLTEQAINQWSNTMEGKITSGQPTMTPAETKTMSLADKSKDVLKEQLASLLQSGSISLNAAIEVMSLYDQHPSLAAFKAELQKVELTPVIQAQLNQLYAQLYAANTQPALPPAPTPDNQQVAQQAAASSLKNQIDEWIKQGYVTQDNNDYVTTIIYENEVLKINGKELPPDITGTPPLQQPKLTP